MNIEELKNEHYKWVGKMISSDTVAEKHTKLSIQFAIEILKDIAKSEEEIDTNDSLWSKIEELKQYLK